MMAAAATQLVVEERGRLLAGQVGAMTIVIITSFDDERGTLVSGNVSLDFAERLKAFLFSLPPELVRVRQ